MPQPDTTPQDPNTQSFKKRGPMVALLVGLVLLVGATVATWRVFGQPQVDEVADAGTPIAAPVDAGAPDAGPSMDGATAQQLLLKAADGLSPSAQLKAWLNEPGFLGRIVAAVASVADGLSPRGTLTFLAPPGHFIVDEPLHKRKKTKTFISPRNDARYDDVTAVVTSISPEALARVYHSISPYLQRAYAEISPAGARFDDALGKAIAHLVSTPIADGPRELVPMHEGTGYAWADPKLEALSPAQKHLLRMGPGNARAVVKQLETFRAAAAR